MYRKRVNSGISLDLSATNGCCGDNSNASCKFSFAITDLTAMTSITIDGVVFPLVFTGETDSGNIATALNQAMIDAGYFADGEFPTIEVYKNTWVDTETIINIYAQAETITMITVPVASENGDKSCIEAAACRYTFELSVGAGLDVNFSDEDVELANPADSPQNVADDYLTGAANTLATDLNLAITTLYDGEDNLTVKRIKVTENLVTAKFEVQVWLFGHKKLALNGELVAKCECKQDYTAVNS